MIACILFGIHYLLLGAFTGATMNFIVVFRNYVFANKSLKTWADSKVWLYIFILVFIISSVLSWQGFVTLLPLFAVILGSITFWLNNTKHIRLLSLISPPFWFVYNFIMNSYAGMIGDTLTFLSILIGIIRFDVRAKSNQNLN